MTVFQDLMRASLSQKKNPFDIPNAVAKDGALHYAMCDDKSYQFDGRNSSRGSGQVTSIAFPAPATIVKSARVYITITEPGCVEKVIELHHCETAAQSLPTLLKNAINGNSTLLLPGNGEFVGYSAADGAVGVVNITGPRGMKFTVSLNGFGILSDGIQLPPMPTTALVTSAKCTAKIPYGYVVLLDPKAYQAAYAGGKKPNHLESDYHKIVGLPSGSTTEHTPMVVIRSMAVINNYELGGCCDDVVCEVEGVDCGECLHAFKIAEHQQEIWVPIESFPAGTDIAQSLINKQVYYRATAVGANTSIGRPVVLPAAAEVTSGAVVPLNTLSYEAVVTDDSQVRRGKVRIGVRPVN